MQGGEGAEGTEETERDSQRRNGLEALWSGAGLEAVHTRALRVERTFPDFDDSWAAILGAPSTGPKLKAMPPDALEHLRSRMRARLVDGASGQITYAAQANAVKGRVAR